MKATITNLYKIFLEPQEVFNDIKNSFSNTYIIVPFIVLFLLGLISTQALNELVMDVQYDTIVERIEKQGLPEDVKVEQLKNIENRLFEPSAGQQVIQYFLAGISIIVRAAFIALAAMLLGNMVYGGTAKYGMILSMTAYVYMINIVEMAVKIPLMLNKWSMEVYTGLGVLGIGEPGTFIHNIFAGIDIFGLWRIILLSIGMAVIYEKKQKQFLVGLLVLWAILILVGSGLGAFFQR